MARAIQADIVFVDRRFRTLRQFDMVAIVRRVHLLPGQPLGNVHQQQRLFRALIARDVNAGDALRKAFGEV